MTNSQAASPLPEPAHRGEDTTRVSPTSNAGAASSTTAAAPTTATLPTIVATGNTTMEAAKLGIYDRASHTCFRVQIQDPLFLRILNSAVVPAAEADGALPFEMQEFVEFVDAYERERAQLQSSSAARRYTTASSGSFGLSSNGVTNHTNTNVCSTSSVVGGAASSTATSARLGLMHPGAAVVSDSGAVVTPATGLTGSGSLPHGSAATTLHTNGASAALYEAVAATTAPMKLEETLRQTLVENSDFFFRVASVAYNLDPQLHGSPAFASASAVGMMSADGAGTGIRGHAYGSANSNTNSGMVSGLSSNGTAGFVTAAAGGVSTMVAHTLASTYAGSSAAPTSAAAAASPPRRNYSIDSGYSAAFHLCGRLFEGVYREHCRALSEKIGTRFSSLRVEDCVKFRKSVWSGFHLKAWEPYRSGARSESNLDVRWVSEKIKDDKHLFPDAGVLPTPQSQQEQQGSNSTATSAGTHVSRVLDATLSYVAHARRRVQPGVKNSPSSAFSATSANANGGSGAIGAGAATTTAAAATAASDANHTSSGGAPENELNTFGLTKLLHNPSWQKDDESSDACPSCGRAFVSMSRPLGTRSHHCRSCGIRLCVFCITKRAHYSFAKLIKPGSTDESEVRFVCDVCYKEYEAVSQLHYLGSLFAMAGLGFSDLVLCRTVNEQWREAAELCISEYRLLLHNCDADLHSVMTPVGILLQNSLFLLLGDGPSPSVSVVHHPEAALLLLKFIATENLWMQDGSYYFVTRLSNSLLNRSDTVLKGLPGAGTSASSTAINSKTAFKLPVIPTLSHWHLFCTAFCSRINSSYFFVKCAELLCSAPGRAYDAYVAKSLERMTRLYLRTTPLWKRLADANAATAAAFQGHLASATVHPASGTLPGATAEAAAVALLLPRLADIAESQLVTLWLLDMLHKDALLPPSRRRYQQLLERVIPTVATASLSLVFIMLFSLKSTYAYYGYDEELFGLWRTRILAEVGRANPLARDRVVATLDFYERFDAFCSAASAVTQTSVVEWIVRYCVRGHATEAANARSHCNTGGSGGGGAGHNAASLDGASATPPQKTRGGQRPPYVDLPQPMLNPFKPYMVVQSVRLSAVRVAPNAATKPIWLAFSTWTSAQHAAYAEAYQQNVPAERKEMPYGMPPGSPADAMVPTLPTAAASAPPVPLSFPLDSVTSPPPATPAPECLFLYKRENVERDQLMCISSRLLQTLLAAEIGAAEMLDYSVLPLSCDSGLIEKAEGRELSNLENVDIAAFVLQRGAQGCVNFLASAKLFLLLNYIFSIGDRHRGNVLIGTNGALLHIDFRFIFSEKTFVEKLSRSTVRIDDAFLAAVEACQRRQGVSSAGVGSTDGAKSGVQRPPLSPEGSAAGSASSPPNATSASTANPTDSATAEVPLTPAQLRAAFFAAAAEWFVHVRPFAAVFYELWLYAVHRHTVPYDEKELLTMLNTLFDRHASQSSSASKFSTTMKDSVNVCRLKDVTHSSAEVLRSFADQLSRRMSESGAGAVKKVSSARQLQRFSPQTQASLPLVDDGLDPQGMLRSRAEDYRGDVLLPLQALPSRRSDSATRRRSPAERTLADVIAGLELRLTQFCILHVPPERQESYVKENHLITALSSVVPSSVMAEESYANDAGSARATSNQTQFCADCSGSGKGAVDSRSIAAPAASPPLKHSHTPWIHICQVQGMHMEMRSASDTGAGNDAEVSRAPTAQEWMLRQQGPSDVFVAAEEEGMVNGEVLARKDAVLHGGECVAVFFQLTMIPTDERAKRWDASAAQSSVHLTPGLPASSTTNNSFVTVQAGGFAVRIPLPPRKHESAAHSAAALTSRTAHVETLADVVIKRLEQQRGATVERLVDVSSGAALLPCEPVSVLLAASVATLRAECAAPFLGDGTTPRTSPPGGAAETRAAQPVPPLHLDSAEHGGSRTQRLSHHTPVAPRATETVPDLYDHLARCRARRQEEELPRYYGSFVESDWAAQRTLIAMSEMPPSESEMRMTTVPSEASGYPTHFIDGPRRTADDDASCSVTSEQSCIAAGASYVSSSAENSRSLPFAMVRAEDVAEMSNSTIAPAVLESLSESDDSRSPSVLDAVADTASNASMAEVLPSDDGEGAASGSTPRRPEDDTAPKFIASLVHQNAGTHKRVRDSLQDMNEVFLYEEEETVVELDDEGDIRLSSSAAPRRSSLVWSTPVARHSAGGGNGVLLSDSVISATPLTYRTSSQMSASPLASSPAALHPRLSGGDTVTTTPPISKREASGDVPRRQPVQRLDFSAPQTSPSSPASASSLVSVPSEVSVAVATVRDSPVSAEKSARLPSPLDELRAKDKMEGGTYGKDESGVHSGTPAFAEEESPLPEHHGLPHGGTGPRTRASHKQNSQKEASPNAASWSATDASFSRSNLDVPLGFHVSAPEGVADMNSAFTPPRPQADALPTAAAVGKRDEEARCARHSPPSVSSFVCPPQRPAAETSPSPSMPSPQKASGRTQWQHQRQEQQSQPDARIPRVTPGEHMASTAQASTSPSPSRTSAQSCPNHVANATGQSQHNSEETSQQRHEHVHTSRSWEVPTGEERRMTTPPGQHTDIGTLITLTPTSSQMSGKRRRAEHDGSRAEGGTGSFTPRSAVRTRMERVRVGEGVTASSPSSLQSSALRAPPPRSSTHASYYPLQLHPSSPMEKRHSSHIASLLSSERQTRSLHSGSLPSTVVAAPATGQRHRSPITFSPDEAMARRSTGDTDASSTAFSFPSPAYSMHSHTPVRSGLTPSAKSQQPSQRSPRKSPSTQQHAYVESYNVLATEWSNGAENVTRWRSSSFDFSASSASAASSPHTPSHEPLHQQSLHRPPPPPPPSQYRTPPSRQLSFVSQVPDIGFRSPRTVKADSEQPRPEQLSASRMPFRVNPFIAPAPRVLTQQLHRSVSYSASGTETWIRFSDAEDERSGTLSRPLRDGERSGMRIEETSSGFVREEEAAEATMLVTQQEIPDYTGLGDSSAYSSSSLSSAWSEEEEKDANSRENVSAPD